MRNGSYTTLEAHPGQGRGPSWSPDGKVVFESNRGDSKGRYAIFLAALGGTAVQLTDYSLNAGHPVLSRDGKQLAFSYGNPTTKGAGIAVIDFP